MYKTQQGLIVRWGVFSITSILFLFGTYRLYYSFSWFGWAWATRAWPELSFELPLVAIPINVSPALLISLGCGIVCLLVIGYLSFYNLRISDFLIDTESEMRKVSWPTPGDVVKSSLAIVFIVVLLAVYILLIDTILANFFKWVFFIQ